MFPVKCLNNLVSDELKLMAVHQNQILLGFSPLPTGTHQSVYEVLRKSSMFCSMFNILMETFLFVGKLL